MIDEPKLRQLLEAGTSGTLQQHVPQGRPPGSAPFRGPVHVFSSLDSTNSRARELAAAGAPEGTVVVAHVQTAGRGRQGRGWMSEPGKNLLMSLLLRPGIPPEFLGIISLYASVSVAAVVEKITGGSAGCKWPNDVMVAGRKICGILSESALTPEGVGAVILGIGLNVNQETFPGLPDTGATSLRLETGADHDLAGVLCSLIGELAHRYGSVTRRDSGRIIDEWTRRSVILGSGVRVDRGGTIIAGTALGVAPNGALRIGTPDGVVDVVAGEVHIA